MATNHPALPPKQSDRTRLPADERRLMLVEAAYNLIAEKGLLGFRIREVAERVGVNHTTLLYHFPTKESLIAAVIDHVGTLFVKLQAPESSPQLDASPRHRLHTYFVNLAFQIRTSPQHFIVIDELFLQARRDPVVRELVQAEVVWDAYLTSIIEDGIRQGDFVAGVPTATIVDAIMVFCKGLPLQVSLMAGADQLIEQFEQWILKILLQPQST